MFPREKRSVDTWLYHVSFKENFGLARRVGEFTLNGGRNERCAERVADLHGRREECRFLWRKSAKTFVPMNLRKKFTPFSQNFHGEVLGSLHI